MRLSNNQTQIKVKTRGWLLIFAIPLYIISISFLIMANNQQENSNEKLTSIENKLDILHDAALESGIWPAGLEWGK